MEIRDLKRDSIFFLMVSKAGEDVGDLWGKCRSSEKKHIKNTDL